MRPRTPGRCRRPPPEPAGTVPLRVPERRRARSTAAAGWNDPAADKLWLYNLHYFDDLNAAGRDAREAWHRALMARWIAENPPGHGNGWEPYPLSLRARELDAWALAGHALPEAAVQSLAVQARWLTQRLE